MACGGIVAGALFPERVAALYSKCERFVYRLDVQMNLAHAVAKAEPGLLVPCHLESGLDKPGFWIAHGGGIGEFVYTNSREAVMDSLRRGFRYIELDLSLTSCGELVAAHDWARFRAIAGADTALQTPLSRKEIMELRDKWKYTPLFAEDICQLMEENPEMILVTDKIQDFDLLARSVPYKDRMIVEAFSCHGALQALRNGFSNVALTVWGAEQLKAVLRYHIPGVVLYGPLIESDPGALEQVRRLHRQGCCIMAHWASVCDKPEYVHRHLGRNISRIYTDTWSPVQTPPAP